MINLYFLLYYEFLKIGLFAIGGGYAALPFLFHLQSQYNWFSVEELTNMIAVSNVTPGPVGINMATYSGYTTAGFFGSFCATLGIITIPFVFVIIAAKLFNKFKNSELLCAIFNGLRPASCALLTFICLGLVNSTLFKNEELTLSFSGFDIKAIILFLLLLIPFAFFKKQPLLVIVAGAIGGIIIQSI